MIFTMNVVIILALVIVGVSCFPGGRKGCNTLCPMYIIKFCGSDGQTYNSNECFLKSQWCRPYSLWKERDEGERRDKVEFKDILKDHTKEVNYEDVFVATEYQTPGQGRNDFETFHTLHYGACIGNELAVEKSTKTMGERPTTTTGETPTTMI